MNDPGGSPLFSQLSSVALLLALVDVVRRLVRPFGVLGSGPENRLRTRFVLHAAERGFTCKKIVSFEVM
jgi:hypothetical protein